MVLDDAPGEDAVRGLLPADGRSGVVVTARGLLGGLAPVGRVDVPPMDPAEALDLLARFVGAARVAADRAAALRVVHGCGLLPLGVRVAGMRLAVAEDATMSDDGTERDLSAWAEREIFSSNGRMDVEDVSADGLTLTATYTNDTWGGMRTRWAFTVTDGRVSHFETGRA